jgi:hypothetical protein
VDDEEVVGLLSGGSEKVDEAEETLVDALEDGLSVAVIKEGYVIVGSMC